MTIIVDRRNTKSTKNASNRDKFLKRYKKVIKKKLNDKFQDGNISDAGKPVSVPIDLDLDEESIIYDSDTGEYDQVVAGNEGFQKGDILEKHKKVKGKGGDQSGNGGDGEDEYMFTLTKEEFYDIYFEDMELPDFIKESMLDTTKLIYKRAGYVKDGIPARLDVLKTLQQSIARRISCKGKDKKPPFIDDVDLRYRHFTTTPKPMLKAVMICMMDVSGSMGEWHKFLAKKFYIFLYLFLLKNYNAVELRFIRYHHEASDVDEETFFYGKDSGGTLVSKGLELVNKIIDEEYPLHIYNIYMAHVSDGDSWENDDEILGIIDEEIMDKLQYYAYLQVGEGNSMSTKGLYETLMHSKHYGKKLNVDYACAEDEIFPVLRNLFKKGKS